MTVEQVRIRAASLLVASALLIGSSSPAFAEDSPPVNAAAADALAQRYARQAERYRALGGVGYKTGMVQRAEQESARYAALAVELRNPTPPPPPRSPQAQYWAAQVERYQRMGGVAYKTGLLQRAQAELEKYEPRRPSVPASQPLAEPWRWGKPVERFLMRGR